MSNFNRLTTMMFTAAVIALGSPVAEAGPLIDWLFGRKAPPAYPVGAPQPVGQPGYAANYPAYAGQPSYSAGYAPSYGTYYGSQLPVIGNGGLGYQAPRAGGITAATLPPTVSYTPNYRSYANRAAVTYYRPVLTTDPATGAQVVSMAPCTSYEYQNQRVPTLGRSMLFGSGSAPPIPPPAPALPSYTLPPGGVPLASSLTAPTVRGYAPVASQPPAAFGDRRQRSYFGTYATDPYAQVRGYSSYSGGSCGAPVPGLVAPQAPLVSPAPSQIYTPSAPAAQPSAPSPFPQGSVVPSAPSADPRANEAPSLPSTGLPSTSQLKPVPQLKSIAQQPVVSPSTNVASSTESQPESASGLRPIQRSQREQEYPVLEPIPIPEEDDFNQRWNPGLLSEQDMTASRDHSINSQQRKKIRWASFESSAVAKEAPVGVRSKQSPNKSTESGARPAWNCPPPRASAFEK